MTRTINIIFFYFLRYKCVFKNKNTLHGLQIYALRENTLHTLYLLIWERLVLKAASSKLCEVFR